MLMMIIHGPIIGANITKMQEHLQSISHALEEIDTQNKHEHEQLNKKTEEEIKRFSEDAQFLNQVRDIIHFFKKA